MRYYFERFSISLKKADAEACSHPGQCDADVADTLRLPYVRRQLAKIDPELIRAELAEYGAWDESQLSDAAENEHRIIWIAASNMLEESRQ